MFESLGFACSYRCSLGSSAGGQDIKTFRGGGSGPWSGGLVAQVAPEEGLPWAGQFEFDAGSLEKICATPSPNRLMVVARGEGYIVRADKPDEWEYAAVAPVLDVRRVPEREILVCADFQDLVAYGRNGLMWVIDHLALDDLEITKVLPDEIQGFLRHETLGRVPFCVDPSTGHVEGGSEIATVLVPRWGDAQGLQQSAFWSD